MKRLVLFLLIAVMVLTLVAGCSAKEESEKETDEEEYIPVEVEPVISKTLSNQTFFSGKVYPGKTVMVVPQMVGVVDQIEVKVGDKVEEGDVLFKLDSSEVQKQVNQAKDAVDAAQSAYDETKSRVDEAKANLEQSTSLYQQGLITEEQYQQGQMAASDEPLKAIQAQVNQAQGAYDQAKGALDKMTIKAPITGRVASINIQEDQIATNAQPAMTLISADDIYVGINVTEDIVNDLETGQNVFITISSAFDGELIGEITTISPMQDMRTQLYPVEINLDNYEASIKPGMSARVEVNTDTREDVVVVKSEGVVQKDERSVVYVLEGDKAVEKEVTTGLDTGVYTEILQGLKSGERILVKGQNYVENGTKVKVVRGEE